MAEGDGRWIAAVLTANADLQLWAGLASALDADPHKFADALLVDGDKGIAGKDST